MRPQTNLQEESSLLYWFPKIEDILPVPKTIILEFSGDEARQLLNLLDGKMCSEELYTEIKAAGNQIGYPLFLRTDQGSGKHDWKDTCYVKSPDEVVSHAANLAGYEVVSHAVNLAGWQTCEFLPSPRALVFREMLPLYSTFTAFWQGLPIAKERRYFVENGKILCHHPYWPEGAIQYPDHENWVALLEDMNREDETEVKELTKMAEIFSRAVPGFYSVDFAMTKDGRWYMIDAARGELSWHPEHEE